MRVGVRRRVGDGPTVGTTVAVTVGVEGAQADRIKASDKLIFTPDGVFPNLIFNNGAIPSFDISK